MNWVVQAPARNLGGDEKKLFVRVRQTLWDYEPLRASHAEIVIGIRGSSVRLSGRVRTTNQKVLAELLTRRLQGVDDVTNDLVADPEVVRQVAHALALDSRTAPYVLRVDSRHGVVSLQGDVPDEATSQAALAIASAAPGVALVRNQLTVGGPTRRSAALIAEPDQPGLPG
jgi:osmotically-inducible protein OsmY